MGLRPKRFDDGLQPGPFLDGVRTGSAKIRKRSPVVKAGKTGVDALADVFLFRRRDDALSHSEMDEWPAAGPRMAPETRGAPVLALLAHPPAQNQLVAAALPVTPTGRRNLCRNLCRNLTG